MLRIVKLTTVAWFMEHIPSKLWHHPDPLSGIDLP